MKTYAKNYAVFSTKAGKQLRSRFNASTVWFGTADIVREYQNPDGPQTVVEHYCTPYFTSGEEAREDLSTNVERILSYTGDWKYEPDYAITEVNA